MQDSNLNAQDRFAQWLGVRVLSASFEQAECCIALTEQHRNALGGIHGALIFALADMAFAAACNAGSATYIGLQAEIRYMSKVQGELLHACATLVGGSKKISHYQVLLTDAEGARVALFSASAYRLS